MISKHIIQESVHFQCQCVAIVIQQSQKLKNRAFSQQDCADDHADLNCC